MEAGVEELKAAVWRDFRVASFFPSSAASGRVLLPIRRSGIEEAGEDGRNGEETAREYREFWLELIDDVALGTTSRMYDFGKPASLSGPSTAASEDSPSASDVMALLLHCPNGRGIHLRPAPCRHGNFLQAFTPPLRGGDKRLYLLFQPAMHRLASLALFFGGINGNGALRARTLALPGRVPAPEIADLLLRFVFYQLLRSLRFSHSGGASFSLATPCLHCGDGDAGAAGGGGSSSSSNGGKRSISANRGIGHCGDGDYGSELIVTCSEAGLSARDMRLTAALWLQMLPPGLQQQQRRQCPWQQRQLPAAAAAVARLPAPRLPPGEDAPLTVRWCNGWISNLEYIMALNRAAGRDMASGVLHPVVPWVSNFTAENGGWRDLSKTKYRLKKGDAQLDSTFASGRQPHHLPETLSELTYSIYMARRLPLLELRRHVRSGFVARHYPASVARMYEWSPDECIPEYYTDASVFRSVHTGRDGLGDLQVPPWCDSPESFVACHRRLLESPEVSRSLHLWIDLTFGCCLEGPAAVANKNVPLDTALSPLLGGDMAAAPDGRVAGIVNGPAALPGAISGDDGGGVLSDSIIASEASDYIGYGSGKAGRRPRLPLTLPQHGPSFVVLFHAPHPERSAFAGRDEDVATAPVRARDVEMATAGVEYSPVTLADAVGLDATAVGGIRRGWPVAAAGAAVLTDHFGNRGRLYGGKAAMAAAAALDESAAATFAVEYSAQLEPLYDPGHRSCGSSARSRGKIDSSSGGGDGGGCSSCRDQRLHLARYTPQQRDLFAAGCLLADLYAGRPLLSRQDLSAGSIARLAAADALSARLPLQTPVEIRAAILTLTHPNPAIRQSPEALLAATCPAPLSRQDGRSSASTSVEATTAMSAATIATAVPVGAVTPPRTAAAAPPLAFAVVAAATVSLPPLFPACFSEVYDAIAGMMAGPTRGGRLALAVNVLPRLTAEVPLPAFCLFLPHVAVLIELDAYLSNNSSGGSSGRIYKGGSSSGSEGSGASGNDEDDVAAGLTQVVDCVGRKLGPDGTCRFLLPMAATATQALTLAPMAVALLRSPFFAVLAERAGTAPFLNTIQPQLLRWLASGTGATSSSKEARSPAAAGPFGSGFFEGSVFSSKGSRDAVQRQQVEAAAAAAGNKAVKTAAAAALSTTLFDVLGAGMGARFLLPALMDELVNVVTAGLMAGTAGVAAAGRNEAGSNSSADASQSATATVPTKQYLAAAVAAAAARIGSSEVTVALVLERLGREAFSAVTAALWAATSGGTAQEEAAAAVAPGLLQALALLRLLLPTLPSWGLERFYLTPPPLLPPPPEPPPLQLMPLVGLPELTMALASLAIMIAPEAGSSSVDGGLKWRQSHAQPPPGGALPPAAAAGRLAAAELQEALLAEAADLLVSAAARCDPAVAGRALVPVADALLRRISALYAGESAVAIQGSSDAAAKSHGTSLALSTASAAQRCTTASAPATGASTAAPPAVRVARAVYCPLAAMWGVGAAAAALSSRSARLLHLLGEDLVPRAAAMPPAQDNLDPTGTFRGHIIRGVVPPLRLGPLPPPLPLPLPGLSPSAAVMRKLSGVFKWREGSVKSGGGSGARRRSKTGGNAGAGDDGTVDPLLATFWPKGASISPIAAPPLSTGSSAGAEHAGTSAGKEVPGEQWLDLLGAVGSNSPSADARPSSLDAVASWPPSPLTSAAMLPSPVQAVPAPLPSGGGVAPADNWRRLCQRTWLLGRRLPAWEEDIASGSGDGGGGKRLEQLGRPWSMKMCLQASTLAHSGVAVTSLSVGPGRQESLVLSGAANGGVYAWDVRGSEPQRISSYGGHNSTSAVTAVEFFCNGDSAASLNGAVHVWDVRRGTGIAQIHCPPKFKSKFSSGENMDAAASFVAFQLCEPGAGVLDPSLAAVGIGRDYNSCSSGSVPGDHDSGGYAGWDQQLVAASASGLYQYDLRARDRFTSGALAGAVHPAAVGTWPLAAALRTLGEPPGGAGGMEGGGKVGSSSGSTDGAGIADGPAGAAGIGCLTCCPGSWGDWVAVGASGGQVAVLDRRNGRLMWLWRAHDGPVVRLFVTGRNRLLSVGADRCAVSWDLSVAGSSGSSRGRAGNGVAPLQAAVMRGLPDRGGGVPAAAVVAERLNPGSRGETLLFAISRHKILASVAPQDGQDETGLPCSFLGPDMRRIRRYHGLAVSAAALLPLRRLLLLGCEDGWLRACA